jgi:hypothetical protein
MATVYAISYKGFPISKIGTTSMDVRVRAQQLGFVLSDDLEIATVEVKDGFAVERVAHNIADQRGGQCLNAIANNLFQNPNTWEGIRLNSGNTEVYCVTFKQACRIIKEAAKMVQDTRQSSNPLVDYAKIPLRGRSTTHSWKSIPVKTL